MSRMTTCSVNGKKRKKRGDEEGEEPDKDKEEGRNILQRDESKESYETQQTNEQEKDDEI